MTFLIRIKLVTLMSLLLIACGGSGSSGGNDSSGGNGGDGGSGNTLLDPKLALSNQVVLTDGKLQLKVGDELALPVTTDSDATVSYSSSDESVVKVGEGGGALKVGSATITIRVAATAKYNAASLSVDVVVFKGPQSLSINGLVPSAYDISDQFMAISISGNRSGVPLEVSNGDPEVIGNLQANNGGVRFIPKKPGTAVLAITALETEDYLAGSLTLTLKVRGTRSVSFADGSDVNLTIGETLTRKLEVSDSTEISYRSSNDSVASVDDSGRVVALREGSATITAQVAANDEFSTASASYNLTVVAGEVSFYSEVDDQYTSVVVSSTRFPVNYDTAALGCSSCPAGRNGKLSAADPQFEVPNAGNPIKIGLQPEGQPNSEFVIDFAPRPKIRQAAHVEFNGYWWIFGGTPRGQNLATNDIWRSKDGHVWEKVATDNPFSPRYLHGATVLNNEIWIAGGLYRPNTSVQNTFQRSVWKSRDGINWTEAKTALPTNSDSFRIWSTRAAVFKNKLYVLAGGLGVYRMTGLYTTSDGGDSWQRVIGFSSNTSVYSGTQMVALKDRLVISDEDNNVHYSLDGINWPTVKPAGSILSSNISGTHVSFTFNDRIWAVGTRQKVYSSADAIKWTQESDAPAYSKRTYFDFGMHFNGRFWIGGGTSEATNVKSEEIVNVSTDTWVSDDLKVWNREESQGEFPGVGLHDLAVFGDKLWLIGGARHEDNRASNETWFSSNGRDWQISRGDKLFENDYIETSVVQFKGALWSLDVEGSEMFLSKGELVNNELQWTRGTSSTSPFPPRRNAQLVVFKNKLWIIGGRDTVSPFRARNDALYSEDGINWTAAASAFDNELYDIRAIANDDYIIVVGDEQAGQNVVNPKLIWSNDSGATWNTVSLPANTLGNGFSLAFIRDGRLAIYTNNDRNTLVTESSAGFNNFLVVPQKHPDTGYSAVEKFKDRYWMISGTSQRSANQYNKGIWTSYDGLNWDRIFKGKATFRALSE